MKDTLGEYQSNGTSRGPPGPIPCRRTSHFHALSLAFQALPGSMGARLDSQAITKALPVRAKLLTCQPPILSLLPSSSCFLLDLPLSPPLSLPIIAQLPPDQSVCSGHVLKLKQTLALEEVGSFTKPTVKVQGRKGRCWEGMIPMHMCPIREHLCRSSVGGGEWRKLSRGYGVRKKVSIIIHF